MKALIVHVLVIGSTLVGGDLTFNHGRESKALYRDAMPGALVTDGKRAGYNFSKDVTGFLEPVLRSR